MGIRITANGILEKNISQAQNEVSESMEKLSSGIRFTRNNAMPAERAQSDSLTAKMREMNVYKKNASDGLSLTQFADSTLSELSNINIRMGELVTQSTNPTLSDKERQFLFIEYQSLYNEMDRQATTTSYDGDTLLNYQKGNHTEISFRVGSPAHDRNNDSNIIKINDLDQVKARPKDLGLKSAKDLLENYDGVSLEDVLDNFDADDTQELHTSFNEAREKISGYRGQFGAIATRLNHVLQSINIAYENISASNSRLRDVDYASEVTNLTRANILMQAGTSLLSQKQQLQGQTILTLISNMDK